MIPLIVLALIILPIIVYFIYSKSSSKSGLVEPQQIKNKREQIKDNQCSICLSQEKILQVSSSCSHSFCGNCLIGLHQHSKQQLKCPLCRQDITIIFICFKDKEPKAQINNLIQKIHQYNNKYGNDNRSFVRKLKEFPYVLKAIGTYIFSLQFIKFFLTTANLAKLFMTIGLYLLSPIDLIPQLLVGVAGFIDDIFFFFIAILFSIANVGIQYIRRR